jgi:hypothetical protein
VWGQTPSADRCIDEIQSRVLLKHPKYEEHNFFLEQQKDFSMSHVIILEQHMGKTVAVLRSERKIQKVYGENQICNFLFGSLRTHERFHRPKLFIFNYFLVGFHGRVSVDCVHLFGQRRRSLFRVVKVGFWGKVEDVWEI